MKIQSGEHIAVAERRGRSFMKVSSFVSSLPAVDFNHSFATHSKVSLAPVFHLSFGKCLRGLHLYSLDCNLFYIPPESRDTLNKGNHLLLIDCCKLSFNIMDLKII